MNKNALKSLSLSVSTVLLLSMAGCSGGGGSSASDITSAVSNAFSGVGIDGILVGSTVCVDANENATCDTDEPSAVTDAQGKFEIPATTVTGPLLLVGGKDIGTGLAFTGTLSAPAGSTVVTPLTSAVQSLVKSGKSAAEAEANVKAALGVPTDVNLTTFDPFNEVSANAQAVLASQAHLQTIVQAASVAVASADVNQNTAGVMSSVFSQISQSFNGATTDVNLSVADVTAATKTVANTLYANNPVALVSVKNNAEATAQSAVVAAQTTQANIKTGTAAEAQGNLNTGITLVNTSIAADINKSVATSTTAAGDLNATVLQAIVDAQAAQEAKEAEIAAAVAAAKAAAVEKAQAEADYAAAQTKAAYDALLEAQAEELRQAEAERAAKAAAQEAAALAAAQEAQLAADQAAKDAAAAQAAAELAAAQAQAQAEAAEAAARIAAAEAAAAEAKAAADLVAAQAAAANAERNAAINIMKTQAEALVARAYGYIPQVTAAKDSIVFIQSLDSNYSTDNNISSYLTSADTALTALGTYAGDTNTSAQSLYTFAAQVAAEANVTDANVTDANSTLQFVISNEALAASQVAIAQTALDATRARVIEIQEVAAAAQAAAAAEAEKQRVIDVITAALTTAQDKNVTGTLNEINASIVTSFTDLNATLSIASDYPGAGIDTQTPQGTYDNALVAKTAAEAAAADFAAALSAIEAELVKAQDGNITEVVAQEKLADAVVAATVVETKLSEINAIKTALAVGLSTAEILRDEEIARLAAEAALRIEAMQSEVVLTASEANAMLADATGQVTQLTDTFASYEGITQTYPETATALSDFNTSLQILLAEFSSLEGNVTIINDANVSINGAVLTQDEAAATTALNSARTAFANIEAQGPAVEPLFASIATNIADIQAIIDAAATTTSAIAFVDGFGTGGFSSDENGNPIATYITLSGGVISDTKYALDTNGSFVTVTAPSGDYVLVGGVWTSRDTLTSYNVSSDSLTVTMEDGTQVQISQEVNLTTIPDSTNLDIVTQVNANVPGDTNVTFSAGAKAYLFALNTPDLYELYWTPLDDTNTSFTTIIDAMNSPFLSIAGFQDANDNTIWYHVSFEKDNQNAVVDNTAAVVTSLAAGQSGNLIVAETNASAGTWSVVTLPSTTEIAVELNVTVDTSTGYTNSLIAINSTATNLPVMIGDYTPASGSFITDIQNVSFNQIAFDNIKAAIEAYAQSQIVAVPDTSGLIGEWVDGNTTLNLASDNNFSITDTGLNSTDYGVYVIDNVVDIGAGDLEGNVTMTFDTNVSDTCAFGLYGDTLSLTCSSNNYNFTKSLPVISSRTIPEIGSWYDQTDGIHLSFLDDTSYLLVVNSANTLGANGVLGGIEIGSFDVNTTDNSLANFTAVINSSGGDTLVGSTITYDATNDTLALNDGTTTYAFVRDDGNTTNPSIGTWLSTNTGVANEVVVLTLHSDGTYMSSNLDISATDFIDNSASTGGIYNAFELGTYSASIVDTNTTITITKNVNTDYDDVFGPPSGDIVFDTTNYPTIVAPAFNITFEKVVVPLP